MSDLKLSLNSDGIYDISLAANGDLATIDSFDTAIIISLFTDTRADSSEMPIPELRRGWWGDLVSDDPDDPLGSKLWLLYQERLTTIVLNKLEDYAFQGLEWFLTEGLLLDIQTNVNAPTFNNKANPQLIVNMIAANSETESRSYALWSNTGTGL